MRKIDTSYRRNLHIVLNNHIPQDIIQEKNKTKSWKYGYNSEYDVVIISKNGTIGEIISIEGLPIALPQQPKNVRFQERQAKDQKWERYKVPKELVLFDKLYKDDPNPESKWKQVVDKHERFIVDDIKRKFNGDWLMVDGKPIYITGHYYFFLQHYKLTDSNEYGQFRMPQRDYFIFVEACFADERSLGVLLLKSRRSAFSTSSCSISLCDAITKKNAYIPVVSKKETDAQKMFARHIVKPLLNLPKYLQPQRTGETSPKKELIFSAPQRKLTTNNKLVSEDSGLDTIIEQLATTIDSYDGMAVYRSINDEIGKLKGELDVNEYWRQHRLCHEVGNEIVGKALCGSTANPPNKGGKNFEKFYADSKISTRNKNGQTKTGLYAIFIPADFSTKGMFDQYGYPIYSTPKTPILNELGRWVNIGVKELLDNEESLCGEDLKKLNAQKRNKPRVDTDPFLDEDATNMYATTGMVNHINFLKEYQTTPKYNTQVFKFNLYYKPTVDNPLNVEMERSDKGKFIASWLPPIEFRNKFILKNGRRYPANAHLGALGIDPYQADRTKYGGGSKMGIIGITTNHPTDLHQSQRNKTFLFYNHRPDTIEEAEKDVIKLMLFLSMPVLVETNKDSLVKEIKNKGLRGYSINDPTKKQKTELTEQIKKYGGIYTSNATRPKQDEALETYIKENVPEEIDENNIKIPFNDLNEMATQYTDSTRTKLDAVVAWQLAALAVAKKNQEYEKYKGETVSEQQMEIDTLYQKEVDIISLFKNN